MQKLAFDNPSGDLFQLSDEMIEAGLEASRDSERKRMILPIHRVQEAEVQRMVNFLQPGTYIRPHKHPVDHATESIILLKGSIRFFTFDDAGEVLTDQMISSTPISGVLDIEPNVWHSFLVLEKDTILFECKKGPYNAKTDKEFAEWSPSEGHQTVKTWLKKLSVKKMGYLTEVKNHLNKAGVDHVLFEGIEANPHAQTINKAAKLGKKESVDFMIALGGGSVMDASKAIAGLIHDDLDDIWPYTVGGPKYRQMKGALPVTCIPTTAATASEVTAHAVISNPEVKGKSPVSYPFMKPSASWLNPAYHTSLPKTTTRDGASDILSHVFENYLLGGNDSDLADRYSEGVMETVLDTLPKLELDPESEHLRGQLLWASTMALNGMQISGRNPAPFTLHNLEHALSGHNPNLAHGRGLAILYPAYFRWLYKNDRVVDRMALLAKRLFGIAKEDQKEGAMAFITNFEGWLKENHLFERLSDQDITEDAFGDVADYAIKIYGGGKDELAAAGPLTRENIIEIFKLTEQQEPVAEVV